MSTAMPRTPIVRPPAPAPAPAPTLAPPARRHERHRPQLAYRLLRRLLRHGPLAAAFDFRIHEIIMVAPWRLRLPPRLPRELEVRELASADLPAIERLRPALGTGYAERFADAHRALGAFLDDRLVAFVWMRCGPAHLPSTFGCAWQLTAPMVWLYDLHSDPQLLGAVSHLYAYLRQHLPGPPGCSLLGQTDHENRRSRLAHRSLGYEVCATLWSCRWGRRWLHLSHARAGRWRWRWRWHGHGARIPLHLLAAPRAAPPMPARAQAHQPLLLQCACGRAVELRGDRYGCACGRVLGRQEDGLAVVGAPIPYWGEIPQPAMAALLARGESIGWRAALAESATSALCDYVANPGRADFHELLPLRPGARVLDVGAGLGGIAASLARHYEVVALEGVAERARFIALRQREDGLRHLTVINADALRVPLGLGQFDLIVANGVFEWVAMMDLGAPPTDVQLLFLHRLRELLAPGGVIYLAVENRIGWSELRGTPDHSGLPYTSLLPRPLARWVCRHSRRYRSQFNTGYRTYTYTHGGYARLYAEVGLRLRTTWISPQGYNRPAKLVPLNRSAIRFAKASGLPPVACGARAALKRLLRQGLGRWTDQAWVWRWLGSDFAFLLEVVADAAPAARAR